MANVSVFGVSTRPRGPGFAVGPGMFVPPTENPRFTTAPWGVTSNSTPMPIFASINVVGIGDGIAPGSVNSPDEPVQVKPPPDSAGAQVTLCCEKLVGPNPTPS